MGWIFDSNSYFVDPSQADDTGDGRTEANAKKTIAALLLLTPPAGSTIFLAGGTHTVTTGNQLSIPTGVDIIGSGSELTTISGDPDNPGDALLEIIGKNKLSGLKIYIVNTGNGQGIDLLTNVCDLTLDDVWIETNDECIQISLVAGTHELSLNNCRLNLNSTGINSNTAGLNLRMENCFNVGGGLQKLLYVRQTGTSNVTAHLKNCRHVLAGGSTNYESIELYTSSTGTIDLTLESCSFFTGAAMAVRTTQISTGTVTVYDKGGNNLTNDNVDMSLGGTLIDVLRSNVLIKGINTSTTNNTIVSTTLDGYATDTLKGSIVRILSGTYSGTTREISASSDATNSITVNPVFPGTLSSGDTFEILPSVTILPSNNLTAIANAVIDEDLSTHTTSGSIGATLNDQVARAEILVSGTVGSIGVTSVILTGGSTVDNYYKNCLILIATGAGSKQVRYIKTYNGTSKIAEYDIPLTVTTDVASTFAVYNIMAVDVEDVKTTLGAAVGASLSADIASVKTDTGTSGVELKATQTATWASNLVKSAGIMKASTVTSGSPTTLVDTTLSDGDDTYKDRIVMFLTGNLKGQAAAISAYDSGTTTFTISTVTTSPLANDTYIII